MKKLFSITVAIAIVISVFCVPAMAMNNLGYIAGLSDDEFLLYIGTPQSTIDEMDSDIKAYIAADLRNSSNVLNLEFTDFESYSETFKSSDSGLSSSSLDAENGSRGTGVLTGIDFSVSSYKSGSTIYIYPTYEFTSPVKPKGNDCFAVQFGDAMWPTEYGGQLWGLDPAISSNWMLCGSLTAFCPSLNSARYEGLQLGIPGHDIYLKGCTYCHASVGSGTDKRALMSYMYNPNNYSWSVSFTVSPFGISFGSTSGTIYQASSIATLTY